MEKSTLFLSICNRRYIFIHALFSSSPSFVSLQQGNWFIDEASRGDDMVMIHLPTIDLMVIIPLSSRKNTKKKRLNSAGQPKMSWASP